MAQTNEDDPSLTAPPSHPTDRRTTVAIALIAVGGVVIGGLVAAGSSWWTATKTSESSNTQALDAYRRDTRRDAYAKTLTDFDALKAWEDELFRDATVRRATGNRLSEQEFDSRIAQERTHYNELFGAIENSCATDELIASRRIVEVCAAIVQRNQVFMSEYKNELRTATVTFQYQDGINGTSDSVVMADDLKMLDNADLRPKFVEAARIDLGATD
jgi:hypothetical protein